MATISNLCYILAAMCLFYVGSANMELWYRLAEEVYHKIEKHDDVVNPIEIKKVCIKSQVAAIDWDNYIVPVWLI